MGDPRPDQVSTELKATPLRFLRGASSTFVTVSQRVGPFRHGKVRYVPRKKGAKSPLAFAGFRIMLYLANHSLRGRR